MYRVLVVAMDPDYVDFSDAGMPPGFDKQKVITQVGPELQQLRDHGWSPDHLTLKTDGTASEALTGQLRKQTYDCILVGAGVRLPVHHLGLFETVLNVVHVEAPNARLALNTGLNDSAIAVQRQITM